MRCSTTSIGRPTLHLGASDDQFPIVRPPGLELPSSPRGAALARARPERHADRPFPSALRRYESRRTDRVVGNRNRVTDQSRNF